MSDVIILTFKKAVSFGLNKHMSLKIKVINFVFKIPNSKYKDDKNVKYLLIFFLTV